MALKGAKILGTRLKDVAPFVPVALTSAMSCVLGGILLLLLLEWSQRRPQNV